MKKLYLICIPILVFLSLKSISQTDEIEIGRINEPTLSFTSIDNFGFVYKLEQKNNWYWRFLFLYGRQAKQEEVGDDYNKTYSHFTPGIGFGIEKRGNYGIEPVLRGFKYSQLNVQFDGGVHSANACPNR